MIGGMGRIASLTRRAAFGVVLAALIPACTSIYRNHGYVPGEDDLAEVVVGTSTQEDVAAAVGRPSSAGILTGAGWYYVGSKFLHYGVRAPREVERQVVAISFDEAGIVENVERFGLENGKAVVISRRVTDSGIKGVGFLRQLLGNISNFNAGQIIGEEG